MMTERTHKKRILVCGAGSIGMRHITNLLSEHVDVFVHRQRKDKNEELLKSFDYKIELAHDFETCIPKMDGVVIATETNKHRPIIESAVKNNKHLYIEKPIDVNANNLNKLKEEIKKKGLAVEVGCQLRQHPCLIKLKEILSKNFSPVYTFRVYAGQRLEDWRPGTDYNDSYSASKSRGGGALLDLIHEIDLTHWLLGDIDEVFGDLSKVSDQKIDAEDLVNIILRLRSGAVGSIQLDLLSPVLRRGIEIISKEAIICWDYNLGQLEVTTKSGKEVLESVEQDFERNDLFLNTMSHFLKRMDNINITPSCSFEDGIKSLEIVDAIESSYKEKKAIKVN